jgi:phosphinothricin acetyltransferase
MTPTVRPATANDAPAIAAIYAKVVIETVTSFEESPPSPAEIRARMTAPPGLPWIVACDRDRVVGYAYAAPFRHRAAYRWSAESSVYIAESARGQGVGRLLYDDLIAIVTDLGYTTLFAGITLPNPASIRLHESVGFTPIGVFRQAGYKYRAWHDVGWWQRLLAVRPADPPAPLPWLPGG